MSRLSPFVFLLVSLLATSQLSLQAQESNARKDTSIAHLRGLRLSPEQMEFTPTAIGDSAISFLTVHNDSLRPVMVTGISGGGSSFHADQRVPLTVPAGGSVEIRAVYTPRRFGRTRDTLVVLSEFGEAKVPLRGRSPFPQANLDKETLDFDSVARGTMSDLAFVISNPSINTLVIDSIWTHTSVFRPLTDLAVVSGGDTAEIVVVFYPVFSGAFSDTLFIESNARDGIVEIPLSGMSPRPVLAVSTEDIRVGEVSITDSIVTTIRVADASISSLNLHSVRTHGFGFAIPASSVPSVVQGNDTIVVPLVFRPREFGEFVDTVMIESDGGSARIPLRGKSPYPILIPTVDTISFGEVRRGTTVRRSLMIKNPSINVLRLDSIYTRTKWFAAKAKKTTVRHKDSLLVEASFVADRFRDYSDTIVIIGNSLNRYVEIPLSGSSPPPEPALALHSLELEPVSLGDTCIGEFVVYNRSGINDLTISGIKKKSPFFSIASRLPATLGRRDSLTLRVRFTVNERAAGGFGVHGDTLQIESDGGTMRVAVAGTSPFPLVTSGTDEVDFGSVQKGARATVPLWISNPSLNTVRIDSIGVRHRKIFSVTGMDFPGIIRKGKAHGFTIAFAPDSDNVYLDTLDIYSNAPGPPLKIVLTGRSFSLRASEGTGMGIPTEFCLFKNYPNPFKGATTIKFGLPRPSTVSLVVFNTLGQLVAELANGYLEAGYHSVVFSSSGLSSGLYFYRFQAGDFIDTKKLVVLR